MIIIQTYHPILYFVCQHIQNVIPVTHELFLVIDIGEMLEVQIVVANHVYVEVESRVVHNAGFVLEPSFDDAEIR